MAAVWVVYVRRSAKRATDAAVSDETQEAMARAIIPAGASVEVISDSGGHQSGSTIDRDGYQELLTRLRAGRVDGIAVYDLSRLHRNARNMLDLAAELEARRVPLRIATMPATTFDGANGRFLFGQLALAAQWQRDMDSDRMVNLTRSIFEAGGHRGLDPFGYVTAMGVKPRTLEIVHSEAAVIRRIWSELARSSTSEIADALNRNGIAHRADRPWTRDAVKDIVRRGRFYLGFVTHRRGAEERPGRHEAILDAQTWQDGTAAAQRRVRGLVRRSTRHRVYLLAGLLRCASCDHRMHGQASLSRGTEWLYYRCRHCPAGAIRAEGIEADMLGRISAGVLPDRVIDAARDDLRQRLSVPGDTGRTRRALEGRLERLGQLYAWGHLPEPDYRAQRVVVERDLSLLPTGDALVLFDRNRALMVSLATSIERATREQLRALVPMLVARAASDGRIDWTGPAAPFFTAAAGSVPPDGLEPPVPAHLRWYLEVAS